MRRIYHRRSRRIQRRDNDETGYTSKNPNNKHHNILDLQTTLGNQAVMRMVQTSQTQNSGLIQRSGELSFQEALSFWKQMEQGQTGHDDKSGEPEPKKGVGTYHEKGDKEDWTNPETATSLGSGNENLYTGKELGDFFKHHEKGKYEAGSGMSQATWGGIYLSNILMTKPNARAMS